jgi:hypothetical protein
VNKLFQSILSTNRKRRSLVVCVAIWLLQQVREVESDEMLRSSDRLDELDLESGKVSQRDYVTVEDEYILCGYALGFLDSAITDLEFAY